MCDGWTVQFAMHLGDTNTSSYAVKPASDGTNKRASTLGYSIFVPQILLRTSLVLKNTRSRSTLMRLTPEPENAIESSFAGSPDGDLVVGSSFWRINVSLVPSLVK